MLKETVDASHYDLLVPNLVPFGDTRISFQKFGDTWATTSTALEKLDAFIMEEFILGHKDLFEHLVNTKSMIPLEDIGRGFGAYIIDAEGCDLILSTRADLGISNDRRTTPNAPDLNTGLPEDPYSLSLLTTPEDTIAYKIKDNAYSYALATHGLLEAYDEIEEFNKEWVGYLNNTLNEVVGDTNGAEHVSIISNDERMSMAISRHKNSEDHIDILTYDDLVGDFQSTTREFEWDKPASE